MNTLRLLSIFIVLVTTGCTSEVKTKQPLHQQFDMATELAAIEETRTAFVTAIKEGRYEDLQKYVTSDVIAVGPGSPEWNEMRNLGAERGTFPYDSLVMKPSETVIVSDSMAYDFGTSIVYYTDSNGKTRELYDTFLVILKKDKDGIWKLHREVASSTIK